MPIYEFLTSQYAMGIYLYGNRTFATINQAYVPSVKQRGADEFTVEQIAYALEQGWITQSEYDETINLKTVQ